MSDHYYYRKVCEWLRNIKVQGINRSAENVLSITVNDLRYICSKISDIIPYEYTVDDRIHFEFYIGKWSGYIFKNHIQLPQDDPEWKELFRVFINRKD